METNTGDTYLIALKTKVFVATKLPRNGRDLTLEIEDVDLMDY